MVTQIGKKENSSGRIARVSIKVKIWSTHAWKKHRLELKDIFSICQVLGKDERDEFAARFFYVNYIRQIVGTRIYDQKQLLKTIQAMAACTHNNQDRLCDCTWKLPREIQKNRKKSCYVYQV